MKILFSIFGSISIYFGYYKSLEPKTKSGPAFRCKNVLDVIKNHFLSNAIDLWFNCLSIASLKLKQSMSWGGKFCMRRILQICHFKTFTSFIPCKTPYLLKIKKNTFRNFSSFTLQNIQSNLFGLLKSSFDRYIMDIFIRKFENAFKMRK